MRKICLTQKSTKKNPKKNKLCNFCEELKLYSKLQEENYQLTINYLYQKKEFRIRNFNIFPKETLKKCKRKIDGSETGVKTEKMELFLNFNFNF